MSLFTTRLNLIKNILTGLGSVGSGSGAAITNAASAAASSTSSAKDQAKEALRDVITVPIVIQVTKPDSSVETFNVTASLNGKEIYFDGNIVNGTTLIIGVTTTS